MQYTSAPSNMRMPGAPQVVSGGYGMPTTAGYPGAMPSVGMQRPQTMSPGVQVIGGGPQVVGGMPGMVSSGPQVVMGGAPTAMGGGMVGPMGPAMGMMPGMGMPGMEIGMMGGMGMPGMGMGDMCVLEIEVVPMAMMMGPGGEMVIMDGMGPMMGGMGGPGGMAALTGGPMGMGGPMGEIVMGPGGGAIVAAPQFKGPQQISLDDLPFSSIGHKAMWQGIFDMVQREVDAFLKQQKNNPAVSQFKAPRIPMPNIPDQQIEMIFDSYDMQKTGFLDRERIKALMRDMQCVTCVAMSNQKGEALQEARQELTMMMGPQLAMMMSGAVSQMMDFELQMVKHISMQDVPDDECNELIRDLDADKDGVVSRMDFKMNAKKALFDPNPPEEIMQAMEAMEAAFNQMSVGGMGGGPMMIMDGSTGRPVQGMPGSVMPGMPGSVMPGMTGSVMPTQLGPTVVSAPMTSQIAPTQYASVPSGVTSTQVPNAGTRAATSSGTRYAAPPSVVGESFASVQAPLRPQGVAAQQYARPPPATQQFSSQQYASPQPVSSNLYQAQSFSQPSRIGSSATVGGTVPLRAAPPSQSGGVYAVPSSLGTSTSIGAATSSSLGAPRLGAPMKAKVLSGGIS